MCSATSKNWAKLINCSLIYSFCPVFVVVATFVPPFNTGEVRTKAFCRLIYTIEARTNVPASIYFRPLFPISVL